MNKWNNIIIHCSDSTWGNAVVIDNWHRNRGWKGIGYHFVIQNGVAWDKSEYNSLLDGAIEPGRRFDYDMWVENAEIGSHALGYNSTSIGICLIGKKKFTESQFVALWRLIGIIQERIPDVVNIIGHYQTKSGQEQGKTCPNFKVPEFLKQYSIQMPV